MSKRINIVWLKKDLRTIDHAALNAASNSLNSTLVIFIFEPIVESNYDFSIRHWEYIYQSIISLQKELPITIYYGDAQDIFTDLSEKYLIEKVFSHKETGNYATYNRDLELKTFFKSKQILWKEFNNNAVLRGRNDRKGWDYNWSKVMNGSIIRTNLAKIDFIHEKSFIPDYLLAHFDNSKTWNAGEKNAHKALSIFSSEKVENYFQNLSYPEKSRYHCSRLSAHITYGNLSIRQIYQELKSVRSSVKNKNSLDQFLSRLKWHCHFVQKLESEPDIEFKNLNGAFDDIRKKKNKAFIRAWEEGNTGLPLVDAAMRCVKETGYLNFRLRAMVVSFFTHHLWQPWQVGARILARYFIDYEPGIHFSQFQMQAGTTGVNTLRIYNPVKQSLEKDKGAEFIKKWVPELAQLPIEFIHRPWIMSSMDEIIYNFKLGTNYPKPIVDIEETAKYARDKLWQIKKSEKSKRDAKIILKKHVRRKRNSHGKYTNTK